MSIFLKWSQITGSCSLSLCKFLYRVYRVLNYCYVGGIYIAVVSLVCRWRLRNYPRCIFYVSWMYHTCVSLMYRLYIVPIICIADNKCMPLIGIYRYLGPP